MAGLLAEANSAAVRAGNFFPDWSEQTPVNLATGADMDLPAPVVAGSANPGVNISSGSYASIAVGVRREPSRRAARLTFTSLVIGDTYTVEIDGTPVTYNSTGDADEAEVLQGIADAINANGTVNLIVEAVGPDDTDGVTGQVWLYGRAEVDYVIDDVSSSGAGVLLCVADAVSCSFEVYATIKSPGAVPSGWRLLQDATGDIDSRGFLQEMRCGALQRVYVRLLAVTGVTGDGAMIRYAPVVAIAPGLVS